MTKKRFGAEEIKKLRYVSDPAISADGKTAAYVVTVCGEDQAFHTQVFLVQLPDGKPVSLQAPETIEQKQPRFTRDGQIVFLGKVQGEFQIFSGCPYGGAMKQLTTARHGVQNFSVSPDGQVVFELKLWPEEFEAGLAFTTLTAEENTKWRKELDNRPYEITSLMYKQDAWFGMRKGELPLVGAVRTDGTDCRLLSGKFEEAEMPSVSPDGSTVVYYGYPYSGTKERTPELFACSLAGGGNVQFSKGFFLYPDDEIQFAPDGKSVVVNAGKLNSTGGSWLPCRIGLQPGQETDNGWLFEDTAENACCHGWHTPVVNYTKNGNFRRTAFWKNKLLFVSSGNGHSSIFAAENGKVQPDLPSEGCIDGFACSDDGTIVYVESTVNQPAELFFRDVTGHITQLTRENEWLMEYELAKTEERRIPSKDGKTTIQYWITHGLETENQAEKAAVLYVHGGPTCCYNGGFWHEAQTLAARNLTVLYPNPRGSMGYGPDFCVGCWGQEAVDDLLATVDDAIAHDGIDPERVGVTGGSYGGFMTNKLIGTTNRFAAAVTQRSLINLTTSYGTGDQGFWSSEPGHEDMTLLDYFRQRKDQSLIRNIDHIKTPLLILHGYKDYRCSFEQAEQLFCAMRDRNPEVPTRMVIFPEANHELTRTGRPDDQVRHLSEMADWFERYLKNGGKKA